MIYYIIPLSEPVCKWYIPPSQPVVTNEMMFDLGKLMLKNEIIICLDNNYASRKDSERK
jgi:hypothetical protein